ncbi:MAG: carboxypeptidase regulatory-like domain-containing protein [Candidatus Acidiferrales bacterium]
MRKCSCWMGCLVLAGLQLASASPRQEKRTAATQSKNAPPKPQNTADSRPAETTEDLAAKLPVRRVVLYKGGVGYFEHLGRVRDDGNVRIDFTSGQLDDVLQSLTVLDLNGGRITGIDYNSEAPFSQRLGTLGLPLSANTDLSKFLTALRGSRVEIRSGTNVITGRLLSVERKTRVSGGTTLEVDLATVVSDVGEVRSVEVTPGVSVRIADHEIEGEVGRYLSLLDSTHQQDLRHMTISTAGTGERQIYVSYVSEVPIWKTTYRTVMPLKAGEQPLLQGWAIVDNTTGEDWNDVELSLAAGAPQSFIEQLSQPYYARRPVVPLPRAVDLTPQTHEGAMLGGPGSLSGVVTDQSGAVIPGTQVQLLSASGENIASTTADDQGRYEFSDVPAGTYRVEFHKQGFSTNVVQGVSLGGGSEQTQNAVMQIGSVSTTVTVTEGAASDLQTTTAEVAGGGTLGSGGELGRGRGIGSGLGVASGGVAGGALAGIVGGVPGEALLNEVRQKMTAAALGQNLGDLFEYKLKDRVTIHKNESALVPVVQAHVSAEKVSLWSNSIGSERPLRALWLTNSTLLTLDGGSFTMLEDGAFAGEGLTDPIKPGERRLLSYAADLGVRVDSKSENRPQRVTRVRIFRGVMTQTRELEQSTTYTVRNDDTTPRTIVIEHPLRTGWKLAEGGAKPEETTSSDYRFQIEVRPKTTAVLGVDESEPLDTRYEISNVTDDQLAFFLKQKTINTQVEAALRRITEQKNHVAALEDQISGLEDQRQKIFDDQQRIRENLKALKGTPEERALTQRYTQQLADQETQLDNLQKEAGDLQAKHDQAQQQLDDMIQNLSLDVTL